MADLSWSHGESVVVALAAESGQQAIVKSHRDRWKFLTEFETYSLIAEVVGDRIPQLLGHDADVKALVLTRFPGTTADRLPVRNEHLYHQAGALLRIIHRAVDPAPLTGWRRRLSERLERWITRGRDGVLARDEIDLGRAAVEAVKDATPSGVIAHCDWQPRNWIVDETTVRAIDFEHARRESWMIDIQKLWWGDWRDAPHLRDAFLDGYDPAGEVVLNPIEFRALAAVHLVSTVVWAVEHGDVDYADQARTALRSLRGSADEPDVLFQDLPPGRWA